MCYSKSKVRYQTKGGQGEVKGFSGNDLYIDKTGDKDNRWIKGQKAGPAVAIDPTLTADLELVSNEFDPNPADPGVIEGDKRYTWTVNGVETTVAANPWKPGNLQVNTEYTVSVRQRITLSST